MQAASRVSYGLSILVFSLLAAVLVSCSTPTLDSVSSVQISEGNQVLLPGDSVTLSVSVEAHGSAVDTVTWASSAPTTAKIDQDGLLTALAPGNADITATSHFDSGKHDSVEVTVLDPAEPLWIRQFGTDVADNASAVASDDDGNILVAGDTEGDLEGPSHGGVDGFVRKLDSNGSELWSHQFGTTAEDHAAGVATDSGGNIIVAGDTLGDLEDVSAGGSDGFVRKLDPEGNPLWTYQFGTPSDDLVAGVTTDIDDNIVVIGHTQGLLGDVAYGTTDVFVLKLDSAGTLLWTHQFGTNSYEAGSAVATDASGHIIVVGHTYGGLEGASAGFVDAFVRKLDPDGNEVWTYQFGTDTSDYATAVATDSANDVLVVGITSGGLGGPSLGQIDAFVYKLAPDGTPRWTHQFGTPLDDWAHGVTTDASDNVIIAGHTAGDLDGVSAGNSDGFVRELDGTGHEQWTRQFGTSALDYANGVAIGASDRVIVAGRTYGNLEGTNAGGYDAIVLMYRP